MTETVTMTEAEVAELAFTALTGAGAREDQARALARAVAAAEREGISSHGLAYLPTYCEHLSCGKVDGQAEPRLERTAPGAVRVDAACGFAHRAIEIGFESLLPLAREQGIAALSLHNSYNCGVLGYHVAQLAAGGLVGLGFTNAPASIAPAGGKAPVLGTNPFALAVPGSGGEADFVIDQSASVVAKSEVVMRARAKEPIPEGWALDTEGRPTTDPAVGLKGSMVPSGGYKGFGVALLVEVMAAALSGATLGIDASPFSGSSGGPPRTGQFFIAIAPASFSGALFTERLTGLRRAIETQENAHLPGSRRAAMRARTDAHGIPVAGHIHAAAAALARDPAGT
ncbi:MAG: Ldh family oxidoreductase [Rhodovibrionaceae bacterium]